MKALVWLCTLISVSCVGICNAEPITIHTYFQDGGDKKQMPIIYVADSDQIKPYLGLNLFETPMPLSVQDASDAAIGFMKKKEASMPAAFGKIKHYIVDGVTLRSYSKESKNLYIGCPFYLVTVHAMVGDKRGFATKLLVLPDKAVLESRIDPKYEALSKK